MLTSQFWPKYHKLFVSELWKIECRSFDHEAKILSPYLKKKSTCPSGWYYRKKKEKCSLGVNFHYHHFLLPCKSGTSPYLFDKQNALHNFQIRSEICHVQIWYLISVDLVSFVNKTYFYTMKSPKVQFWVDLINSCKKCNWNKWYLTTV